MSQKPNHDAKNIGARFRSARSLVPNLNRKSFCERYEINRYTMQSWENGLHVSKGKNVEKFIDALAREGIICTSEWLIDGTGEPARPINGASPTPKVIADQIDVDTPTPQFADIIEKIAQAHQENGDTIMMTTITDDAMAPKFMKGDTVIGITSTNDKDHVHQKYCIIELTPERKIVRKVLSTKDSLTLIALDDRTECMTLNNNIKAIPILWHLLKQ